MNTFEKPEIRL